MMGPRWSIISFYRWPMHIGFVGLGRMGGNMARRLARGGVSVAGFDPSAAARAALAKHGVATFDTLEKFVASIEAPRVVWLMVPAGAITDSTIASLTPLLAKGDVL